MKLIVGVVIGAFYLGLSALAFRVSSSGWAAGHSDLGFWWAVIATLLAIAGLGAMVGSWIHTRPTAD
jgi:hypothetical protein